MHYKFIITCNTINIVEVQLDQHGQSSKQEKCGQPNCFYSISSITRDPPIMLIIYAMLHCSKSPPIVLMLMLNTCLLCLICSMFMPQFIYSATSLTLYRQKKMRSRSVENNFLLLKKNLIYSNRTVSSVIVL